MDGFLFQPRISVDQPTDGVREPSCGRFGLSLRGDRDRFRTLTGAIEREWPARKMEPQMNTDLSLAQTHAFQLARTLMVPVTLFRSGDEFGVLPSDELDDEDDLEIVHEYEPL